MKKVVLSIIVYNSDLSILIKNFESLILCNLKDIKLKIVFIDNNSGKQITDLKSLTTNLQNYFEVLFISSENIGFSGGHNKVFNSIQKEEFDYFFILNPDVIVHKDTIKNLVNFAIIKNNQGIFEAKQFPVEHPKIYDPITFETSWCSGCCLLFPKKIYLELNGFDEDFFLYCEDVDISWRTKALGYKCYIVPDALIFHDIFGRNRNNANIWRNLLLTSTILAKKYNNKIFLLKNFLLYIKHGKKFPFKQIKGIRSYTSDFITKSMSDFKHGFSFSKIRS